jgi:hypothetical protein
MKMTIEEMDMLCNSTQGSCQSLEEVCYSLFGTYPDEYENEMEICNFIDDRIFCCEGCSWWCEMSQMTNDLENEWTCVDCAPNIED